MLTRAAKAAFYRVAGPAMWVNGHVHKAIRAPRTGDLKLHLGPGRKNYLPGWVNLDANVWSGKADVWADLRNPLPFHDNSALAAYSHHMIEHLPNLSAHFQDVFRTLRSGGVYRVGGPNADTAMREYIAGNTAWFSSWPDDRRSVGGRLENFLMCRGEHLTLLTPSFLRELLEDAGFVEIEDHVPSQTTGAPDLFGDCLAKERAEDAETGRTLILEARKA